MSVRGLPPGPTTQRSAEHQREKLHWPVIAVSLTLALARGQAGLITTALK
jgi:hypothetical protein